MYFVNAFNMAFLDTFSVGGKAFFFKKKNFVSKLNLSIGLAIKWNEILRSRI